MLVWKADSLVTKILYDVKEKHHVPRLSTANLVIAFDDSKPFVKNKLNLGKLSKFSPLAKLWQGHVADFCLTIPMDLWHTVLQGSQREAYLDLQLTRCSVDFLPEEIEENGKKKKIKDEFGRIKYTKDIKYDDEGNPKWKIKALDLEVFAENVRRYGLWCDDLLELKDAIIAAPSGD